MANKKVVHQHWNKKNLLRKKKRRVQLLQMPYLHPYSKMPKA
jgi:hypothetical protein